MIPFRAVLAVEGTRTDEGYMHRVMPLGVMTWRALPLTLRAIAEDFGGHGGAFPIGRIDTIERIGPNIVSTGMLDDEGTGEDADRRRDVIRQITTQQMNGVSVDPGGVAADETCIATDADGWCTEVDVTFTLYEIGAATVVPIPAMAETIIEIVSGAPQGATVEDIVQAGLEDGGVPAMAAAVVASGIERFTPPAEWFEDPALTSLTRVAMVTDDGRIFGHLCSWDDCHIAFSDRCQKPWDSPTDFAFFHSCEIDTDAGPLAVGPIAATGGHAPTDRPIRWQDAQAVYDDPTSCAAYARIGRDEFGIWFSGAVRPEATAEQVEMLMTHQLSGDWRRIGGAMEVVAACAVNVPGFVRALALTASGMPQAAVVAGMRPAMAGVTASAVPVKHECSCGGTTAAVSPAAAVTAPLELGGYTVDPRDEYEEEIAGLRARLATYDSMFAPQLREHLLARLGV